MKMGTLEALCAFFSVQLFLGIVLYIIVIYVLIRHKAKCFKGSYYTVTISLGIADVLSAIFYLFIIAINIPTNALVDTLDKFPIIFVISNDFINVSNVVVICHLLSITINRVAAVGFATTNIGHFVGTDNYAIFSLIFSWGCGIIKVLIYLISGCNGSGDLYNPIYCPASDSHLAKLIMTLFISIEAPIVASCILLHFLLAIKIRISRQKFKSLQNGAKQAVETASQKLIFLSMTMTLTLMIPYSIYVLAFAGLTNLDAYAMSMVSVEGIILNGVGNAIFHIVFNSQIREKLIETMKCRQNAVAPNSVTRVSTRL